jgi:predicted nucleotidyltransferase
VKSFQIVLQALAENQVNFLVVGGFAAIAHGSAYVTDDLDICYERTLENYKKIIRAIAQFHPRPRGIPEDLKAPFDEHSLAQGTNFTLTTDIGNLDLLGELSGVGGYRDIVKTATSLDLSGVKCKVASLDTLIRSKEAVNRPKDRAVLPELRAMRTIKETEKGPEKKGRG